MNIVVSTEDPIPADTEWLAVPFWEDGAFSLPAADRQLGDLLARLFKSGLISGAMGDSTPVLGADGVANAIQVYGVGARDKFDAAAAFNCGVALAKRLGSKQRGRVTVMVPIVNDLALIATSLTEGLVVGSRGPDLRKAEKSRFAFEHLVMWAPDVNAAQLEAAVKRGEVIGKAVNLARELVNLPPAEKNPPLLAERALAEAASAGIEVEVWDEKRIAKERFGGLLGVAAGSDVPPRFVTLHYKNGGANPTLALVGKGVTFDSGGLSLKPSASMEDMKSDMTGAAVVLATMVAAARLKLPVNVTGYLALTENMTGGKAMKLGDVLTMRNGKTVEVLNTDAEGRLILADALSFAVEHQPARVLNLATLTGACMVALGTKIAGLFSNNDEFADAVTSASKATSERLWRLPLDADFFEGLKSTVADMKNVAGRWGGASTAAKFLEQFVGETPWVHLDIAGPSWADSDSASRDAGGSGCFVRTLLKLIEA